MFGRIPKEIRADVGPLLNSLTERGFNVSGSEYSPEHFGNFYVDVHMGTLWLRIVRDRLQYFVEPKPPSDSLPEHLNAAFDDVAEFERTLLAWVDAA